jgi:hypothetical protein
LLASLVEADGAVHSEFMAIYDLAPDHKSRQKAIHHPGLPGGEVTDFEWGDVEALARMGLIEPAGPWDDWRPFALTALGRSRGTAAH